MENVNQTQHPSPAAERRSTLGWWITVIGLLSIICCLLTCVGGYIAYNFTDIMNQVNELVEFDFDPSWGEVRPEGTIPADADEDETDTDTAPSDNNEDGWQIDYEAFERLPDGYCAFAGGVTEPWIGVSNVNYVGLLRQDAQEDGFSWQAFTQHTTDLEKVDGYTIPDGVEWVNDGGLQAEICNIDGELVVFIADREGDELVQFNEISYTLLDGNRLLVCSADSGVPGDYNGDCADDETVIRGISIYDVDVPYDLQYHFDMTAEMLRALRSNYRSGNLIDVRIAWIK